MSNLMQAFQNAVTRAKHATQQEAIIGAPDGNIAVPGMPPSYCYVQITENGSPISTSIAINDQVSLAYGTPVLLEKTKAGEWAVLSTDPNQIAYYNSDNVSGTGCPPHSHRIGSPLFEMTEGRRIEPGFIGVATGLYVSVLPTFVPNGTTQGYVAQGTLNLTSYVPGSAGMWCWCKIGFDPTGAAVFATSTPQSTSTPLTAAQLAAIPLAAGVSPDCGVKLTNGETDINLESDFLDCKNWINAGAGGGTDANAIHVNVANEISTIAVKATPVSADLLVIEDSAAAGVKKKITVGSLPGGGSPIAARYNTMTAQSLPNGATTILNYDTNVYDTDSAVTTGASWHFTAPRTGYYHIDVSLLVDGTATFQYINIFVNGSSVTALMAFSTGSYIQGSDLVHLNADDTLDLRFTASANDTIHIDAQWNYVSIHSI